MYLHFSAFSFFVVLLAGVIYYRRKLLPIVAPYLPTSLAARLSNYVPLQSYSFADQAAAGMTSNSFDVESNNVNLEAGESRVGLDQAGVEEVRRIMAIHKCTFDQARLMRHNDHLRANGIAPDGTPLDSKAITRLS